ncbi:hypothetical protein ACVI1N_006313 [Sinorhizobium medicae]
MGGQSPVSAGYIDFGEGGMKKSKGNAPSSGAKTARMFDTEWRLNNTARWVESAAKWLAEQDKPPVHVISVLKDKFGLRALEACRACAMANQFRGSGRASI